MATPTHAGQRRRYILFRKPKKFGKKNRRSSTGGIRGTYRSIIETAGKASQMRREITADEKHIVKIPLPRGWKLYRFTHSTPKGFTSKYTLYRAGKPVASFDNAYNASAYARRKAQNAKIKSAASNIAKRKLRGTRAGRAFGI